MGRNELLLLAVLAAGAAQAQFFQFGGRRAEPMPEVKGTVRLEPHGAVVGIPCNFVFTFDAKSAVNIQNISGLPDRGVEYLSDTLEPYADNTYRLPVRFLEPCTNTLAVVVQGMQTLESGRGTAFRSSYSTSFQKRLPPIRLDVRALPEAGRPPNFSGSVGTRFKMEQKLVPDRVHPGDLVTATYQLTFDGYCPSNLWPRVDHLTREFKAYEPKLVSRTPQKIVWTQVLVPRTTSATNSALVSVTYFNSVLHRYEVARAYPQKLTFVSSEAADTNNTTVVVAAETATAPSAGAERAPLVLRFAPSDASPVVATCPFDTPARELARTKEWRRVETARAIGWIRLSENEKKEKK